MPSCCLSCEVLDGYNLDNKPTKMFWNTQIFLLFLDPYVILFCRLYDADLLRGCDLSF